MVNKIFRSAINFTLICVVLLVLLCACAADIPADDTPNSDQDIEQPANTDTPDTQIKDYTEHPSYDPTNRIFGGKTYQAQATWEPWYLDGILTASLREINIPEGYEKQAVRVTTLHEIKENGILIKIELFREEWKIGDVIQMRATITNQSGKDIVYMRNNMACDFHLSCDAGTQKYALVMQLVPDAVLGMEYETEDVRKYVLYDGETTVIERAAQITGEWVVPDATYAFSFDTGMGVQVTLPYEVVTLPDD